MLRVTQYSSDIVFRETAVLQYDWYKIRDVKFKALMVHVLPIPFLVNYRFQYSTALTSMGEKRARHAGRCR